MSQQVKRIRLQKQIANKYKGHPIYKYRLNIPTEIIEKLNWNSGEIDVEFRLRNQKFEIVRTAK